jgi:hypothetical protein
LASDKLFFVLFKSNPDLILRWLDDLPVVILEALAEALLEFTGPADLVAWMAAHN